MQAKVTNHNSLFPYLCIWWHAVCVGSLRVLDDLQYHKLADETLEELGQFFEDLGDTGLCPSDYDVALAVSTHGVYSNELAHCACMRDVDSAYLSLFIFSIERCPHN